MKIDEREDIREENDDSFSIEDYDKSLEFNELNKYAEWESWSISDISSLIEQIEFTKDNSDVDIVRDESIKNKQKQELILAKMKIGQIIEWDAVQNEYIIDSNKAYNKTLPKKYWWKKWWNIVKPRLSPKWHRYIRWYIWDVDNICMLDKYKWVGISWFTEKQRRTFNKSNFAVVSSIVTQKRDVLWNYIQWEEVINKIVWYINIEQMLQKVNNIYWTDFSIKEKIEDNFWNEPPYWALQDNHPHRWIYKDEDIEEFISVRDISKRIKYIEYIAKRFYNLSMPDQFSEMQDWIEKITQYMYTINQYKKQKSIKSKQERLAKLQHKVYSDNDSQLWAASRVWKNLTKTINDIIHNDIDIEKYKDRRKQVKGQIKKSIAINNFLSLKNNTNA